MKPIIKNIDYAKCNVIIADALRVGQHILCKVSNNPQKHYTTQEYICAYDNTIITPYISANNAYMYATPVMKKQKVKSIQKILKALAKDNYRLMPDGSFSHEIKFTFDPSMFYYCDKELPENNPYVWEPEWLEPIED